MEQITKKTTAMLLDELITTVIKLSHFSAAAQPDNASIERLTRRKELLTEALDSRLGTRTGSSPGKSAQQGKLTGIGQLFSELAQTLIGCWNAQEQVTGSDDPAIVTPAAKAAQKLNAQRNGLIRAIDQALGEGSVTVTEKTYG